ncbi:MAG: dihydrofolate reductase [Bacteroidetes bacterium]|nr:MAG: dihydrofolate reductase [Bacteroidota bacterium]
MKQLKIFALAFVTSVSFWACNNNAEKKSDAASKPESTENQKQNEEFKYLAEQFADLKIIRYRVPGFEELTPQQKELAYYLYEAALAGRDIMWDQNFKHNLKIRRTLEAIFENFKGDKSSEDWKNFEIYTKRVWFSNGIHHHYSNEKFEPEFSQEFFKNAAMSVKEHLPLDENETAEQLLEKITPVIFDKTIAPKKVNLNPEDDLVLTSAVNFYEGVTQKEVEDFYGKMTDPNDPHPISVGLNSKVIKDKGEIKERVWKVGGMYSPAIEKIVYWLEKAITVAENDQQKKALELLVKYYKTGDLKTWDEYNIAWVNDTNSVIDVVNGFIEVYNDPLGYKGSYESVVSFKDKVATKRIATIGANAQWFEDHSPIPDEYKKEKVKGISAKVITVIVEAGDASPSTPIGINLPNANWIRAEHGSKSVNLGNIVEAYEQAAKGGGALEEFYYSEEEIKRQKEYGSLADKLHTDMHEVIGHASGKLKPGVKTPKETLKNYSSTLEEARADLVALYYLMDPKLIEIGVMPSLEVGKAAYDDYIVNGLMRQLVRLKPGEQLEEAHMRNRQMVAKWVYEKGKADNVIEKKTKDGKTYFVINNYEKLRTLFGELLREIQRIKSEGDYQAGKYLVETYGVKVDPELHKEVLARWEKLNIAPYGGFINPVLKPVMENGRIVDVKIEYPEVFSEQMLYYAKKYSLLPNYN